MSYREEAFTGDREFLSNFYPCEIIYQDMKFPSVEHAYQSAKTNTIKERRKIQAAYSPAEAKKLGRKVQIRPDWDEDKLNVMTLLVAQKFFDNPNLTKLLLDTGDEILEEKNWWNDQFWGTCKGNGQNHLGKILMTVRKGLETQRDD